MSEEKIPTSVDEVDHAFLSRVLAGFSSAGLLGYRTESLGEGAGFLGDIVRISVEHEDGSNVPDSMIMKFPAASENSRLGQSLGAYEREIRFYTELQPRLNIRTPAYYFSDMGEVTNPEQSLKALLFLNSLPFWLMRRVFPLMIWLIGKRKVPYVLMIEDLKAYSIGDQVGGCSYEEATRALNTMATMHGRFHGSDELDEFPWLVSLDVADRLVQMLYLDTVEQFKENHADWLSEEHIHLIDWLKEHFPALSASVVGEPDTLIHGDFRLDNLCFDDSRGDALLFDWQTTSRGAFGLDLAYFLSGTLIQGDDSESGDQVAELLEHYRSQLMQAGVELSPEEIRWHYEACLLIILHRMVFAETLKLLEMGEGRGVDLLETWLHRLFDRARDIDPGKLLAR